MTKTEFFDLMIANRNYINRDSVITVNSRNTVYVKSVGIAHTGISSHKTEATALVACEKYSRWFAEWLHVEALAINDAYNTIYIYAPGDAAREVWEQLTEVERVASVDCAHREAIRENKSHDNAIAHFAAQGSKICVGAFTESEIKQMAEYCHAEALMMVQESRLIDCLFNPALIEADHAEALLMDAMENAWREGCNSPQKSIVMLKCQTVGEASGEVKEGDTVTVSLQDQNGNKITVTGEVEEILE